MYKPIIKLAKQIVAELNKVDLKNDIGWVSNNPLREFDLFMVKYGQKSEREFGIVKQLFSWNDKSNKNCCT